MRTALYLITVLCTVSQSHAQSFWQHVACPTSQNVTSVINGIFVDPGRAVFVNSANDGFYRSTDGGNTWSKRSSMNGWFLGRSGQYLFFGVGGAGAPSGIKRSSDDGATWVFANNGVDGGLGGLAVYYAAFAPDGRIMVGATTTTCNCVMPFFSTDAGTTWSPLDSIGSGMQYIASMAYVGQTWVVGMYNGLYTSTDNGTHWTHAGQPAGDSVLISHIVVSGDTVIASANGAPLLRSVDRATTWTLMGTQAVGGGAVCIASGRVLLNMNHSIYLSSDAGGTWTAATFQQTFNGIVRQFGVVDDRHIFAWTDQGIYRTSDGGLHWSVDADSITADSLSYGPTYMTLDAVGGVACVAYESVFHTTDRGTTFKTIYTADQYDRGVTAVAIDEDHYSIYLTGSRNALLRSIDNGATWVWIYPESTGTVQAPLYVDPQGVVFVAGVQRGVLRSSDGGNTWQESTAGLPNDVVSCLFEDHNSSLYAGTAYGVFKSTDGGATWVSRSEGMDFIKTYSSVTALQALGTQLIAATYDGVYGSSDGGAEWRKLLQVTTWGFKEVFTSLATSGSRLIAVGTQDHGVFLSSDAGAPWQQMESGLQDSLITSLIFDRDGYLYAGAAHAFYRSQQPLISAVADDVVPTGASLEVHAFPNPATSLVSIEYMLPSDGIATITLTNVLGEAVAIPVRSQRQAMGFHRTSFDVHSLPAGFYWCTVQAGNSRRAGIVNVMR